SKNAELQEIIIKSNANGLALHPDAVDQYVKALSIAGSEKSNNEKLAALWMYAAQTGNMITPQPKVTPSGRQVMLIPATGTLNPPPNMMMSPPTPMMGPPPMAAYRGMTLPYMRATSMPVIYAPPPGSMPGTYRTHKSSKSNEARKKRRAAAQVLRSGKSNAERRQRRKSDADAVDGNPSFQYHGLDRVIADNFLARQEQSHTGSHLDYSSSSGASETYGNTAPSRASSKTKIVCRDVVM
ncbi:hypothetical protein DOY81_013655, partial [Sarcophaga bullata]